MLISRRSILESLTSAGALRSLGVLTAPMSVPGSYAQVTPEIATFAPEMEPLVALIERTPREKCAEMVVAQLNGGVSYRELMAALFLAGIRNVNPRPPGFALHCVFIVHAAHLISLQAPPESRLLPLFYALDTFKASQERDAGASTGDYVMRSLGSVPPAGTALADFSTAMESWNSERAERAVASLARHRNAAEAFEQMWRYGARDYRNIGHKAIFVANAERTLRTIGWQHSEPVLRSLVLGLLDFGKEQQVNGYAFADQCYAGNVKRVSIALPRMDAGWAAKPADGAVARKILNEIRTATPDEACAAVAERLTKGSAGPATIWDAAHLAAGELRMRVSGGATIIGVHAVTSCNGLHHAYLTATDPAVRLLVLLQSVGWMGQFRTWAETRKDNVRKLSIDEMEPSEDKVESGSALADVFANVASKPDDSAARVMRMAQTAQGRQSFMSMATRFTLAKADEVHYYKYLAALIEDIPLVSPQWQPHLAAAVAFYCKGSKDTDPAWAQRARAALGALA
jgi:hypothetical protein